MIRTGDQFLEGLRVGRTVYIGSERVTDVTTHPAFRKAARTAASIYDMKGAPEHRETATAVDETRDRSRIELYFANDDVPDACREVQAHVGQYPDHWWDRALIACQALAGKSSEASLGLDLLREQKVPHTLLDVRNPPEVAVCRIDGSVVIPLGELPRRLGELPQDKPLVVHCKGGGRSLQAVELLREHGFADAASLKGGILAWIDRYAPELPKY